MMSRRINSRSNNTPCAQQHHTVRNNTSPSSLSRTPSSVRFSRSTSSNSLPAELHSSNLISRTSVTHAGAKNAFEEPKASPSLPASFTVSSSAVNINNNKPAMRTLNPAAKEFELPVNGTSSYLYGGVLPDPGATALFAMPSQRKPSPTTTAIASDYTTSWKATVAERPPRAFPLPAPVEHPIPPLSAVTAHVEGSAVEKLINHIRMVYLHKCKEEALHMVAVLNLERHTTDHDLLDIFSAMGASEAIILNLIDLPYGVVSTSNFVIHRGIGVVFFSEKDFAMLGVEKFNNFVPNGQYQQLIVRYCGPDAELSTPSGVTIPTGNASGNLRSGIQSQPPWILPASDLEKVHEEMRSVYEHLGQPWQYMVAIHGLCRNAALEVLKKSVMKENTEGCERWPPRDQQLLSQLKHSIPWRCRSVSAVVWYSSENAAKAAVRDLNNYVPEGQQHKVCLCLLGAPKRSHQFRPPSQDALFRVGVLNQKDRASRAPTVANFGTNISIGSQTRKVSRTSDATSTPLPCPVAHGNDNATVFSQIDAYFLNKFSDKEYYLVAVHKLDIQTDQKNLHEIFYPNGAVNTELYPDNVIVDGKSRRSGVALFSSQGMALEAASRFNDFVPNGQTRPLLTRYLGRPGANYSHNGNKVDSNVSHTDRRRSNSETATTSSEAGSTGQITKPLRSSKGGGMRRDSDFVPQQVHKGPYPFSTPTTPSASFEDLLRSIQKQLSTPNIDAERLEDDMVNLANHPDSTKDAASRLGRLLVNTLVEAKHLSVMLSSPLSGALTGLHDRLGIPKNDTTTLNGACGNNLSKEAQRSVDKRIAFVKQIAKHLLLLLMQEDVPPQTRRVAGTLCAYLFQYSYLRESPCKLAVEFLSKRRAEQKQAAAFAARDSSVMVTDEGHDRRQPWADFIKSFDDMARFWLKDKSRTKSDEYTKEYLVLRAELLAESATLLSDTMPNSAVPITEKGGKAEPAIISPYANTDYFNNKEGPSGVVVSRDSMGAPTSTTGQGTGSTNLSSALLTPSARPTPLRVTKSSMASGSGNRCKQPPFECANSSAQVLPPRVMLTPASNQTQGVSANISLESNIDQSSARVHSFMSNLNAQNSCGAHFLRALVGAPSVTSKRNASPTPRCAASAEAGDNQAVSINHTRAAVHTSETNPSALSNLNAATPLVVEGSPRSFPHLVINHRSDICECTVYVTKLPSSFTAFQVRRLLLNFGDFTKVRLCRDDKEDAALGPALPSQSNPHGKSYFMFVEFIELLSAKAMIEYFRNASHIPNAFDFMRQPLHTDSAENADTLTAEQKALLEMDIRLLGGTRASPARKPIHDQQCLDAVLRAPSPSERTSLEIPPNAFIMERECLFGVLLPGVAIENYNSNAHPELRPPPPPSTLNLSSNTTTATSNNISISTVVNAAPAGEGKDQGFSGSHRPSLGVGLGGPANATPNRLIGGQSTNKKPYEETEEYKEKGPVLVIQAFTDSFMGHTSLTQGGFGNCPSRVPPMGVIGERVDGVSARENQLNSRESSLTRFDDVRSDDNVTNNLQGQGKSIWANFEMCHDYEKSEVPLFSREEEAEEGS